MNALKVGHMTDNLLECPKKINEISTEKLARPIFKLNFAVSHSSGTDNPFTETQSVEDF